MQPSSRLDRLPPYLFAELERKIRGEEGGRGRRDQPGHRRPGQAQRRTWWLRLVRASADRRPTAYPAKRGRPELREAYAARYERRFGVTLDPATEVIPALGAKSAFNPNLALASTRTASPWPPIRATRSTPAARCWRAPRR